MYESFCNSLIHIRSNISRGRYQTFTQIYKLMEPLEREIEFCYRNKCLTFWEYNKLKGDFSRCLTLFCVYKEIQELDS